MMTAKEAMQIVGSILVTAFETEPLPFPESMAYLVLDGDMEKWTFIRSLMIEIKTITIEGNQIHLTEKGMDYGRRLAPAFQPSGKGAPA